PTPTPTPTIDTNMILVITGFSIIGVVILVVWLRRRGLIGR
ncbi:hypothetical protein LCGC14_2204000, partial [marine sediment metagenome]